MVESRKKKVVRVPESTAPVGSKPTGDGTSTEPTWTPTPEAKSQATKLRIIAAVMWVVAIAGEIATIVWLTRREGDFSTSAFIVLIVLIVAIGALAIGGSILWKKANRLDPASKSDTVRFFVQNQLGAIIAIAAFLPLIFVIFTDKNMDSKQKGIAGTIGIVVAAAAVLLGIDWNPPSTEQYTQESNIVQQLTGQNLVYWTKSGTVFHVCEAVPDVNRESKDGKIYEGTVADAHAAGKSRLTQRWQSEAVSYCGYTQEQVDAVANANPVNDPANPEPEPS